MKFVQYQDCISPHQVPLAKELVKRLGAENFRYVYRDRVQAGRVNMGWSMDETASWFVHIGSHPEEAKELLENAEVLLSGMRDVDLWLRRSAKGLTTFVQSERWFKPIHGLPGKIRMLHPSYRRMTLKVRDWIVSDPHARYLAIGPWAAKDMRSLGVPDEKIVPWGYFVEPSRLKMPPGTVGGGCPVKILWVGRMIDWKRVDTIIKAVKLLNGNFKLTLVGNGPCRNSLQKMARGVPVQFLEGLPIEQIRVIMREHDIYVLSSDAQEGWGAALSEALEEGMKAVGTYEAGASAAILPESNLFHAGDFRALAHILASPIVAVDASQWTAAAAAERLMTMVMP